MQWEQRLLERVLHRDALVHPDDLVELGVSHRQWRDALDRGTWQPVAPGSWRHAATTLTFTMRVVAGSRWLGDRGLLFGDTALFALGVEVPEPAEASFLVRRTARSIPNVLRLHTTTMWPARDIVVVGGCRSTTATRAILDWATTGAPVRQLEAAIDSACRLRRTAVSRLAAALEDTGGSGRGGTAVLRELLIDSGGESVLERRFLRLMRRAGLPRPETQVVVRQVAGERRCRVDFAFPGTDLIVEVGGRLGHTSDADRQRETRRRNLLRSEGRTVREFTSADVLADPAYVVQTVRAALTPFMSRP